MFVRRNKELAQTVCILVLLATLGYSIYLYNSLQIKVQQLEVKNIRLESQHQSLSQQLQKVYAENANVKGSLEIEKQEHKRSKDAYDELENVHSKEIEKLHSLNYEEKNKLKIENSKIQAEKDDIERTLDDETDRLEKLKLEKNMLQVKHDDILAQMQNHISDKETTSNALKSLQLEFAELKSAKNECEKSNHFWKLQIDSLKKESELFSKLRSVLTRVGADVLDLKHSRLTALSEDERSLLYKSFGSDNEHIKRLQESRLEAEKIEEARIKQLEIQKAAKEERDRQLEMRKSIKSPSPTIKNIPQVNADPEEDGVVETDSENESEQNNDNAEQEEDNLEVNENNDDFDNGEVVKEDQVIEEIQKLQEAQQQLADNQQANLLELQQKQQLQKEGEETAEDADMNLDENEVKDVENEDKEVVQLNEPPVAAVGDREVGESFINAPPKSDENLEENYAADGTEENEQEQVQYIYDGEDEDAAEEEDDDKWDPNEAEKAADDERRNIEDEGRQANRDF